MTSLKRYLPLMLILLLIQNCIVIPKTVEVEDQECILATKSMTIDYYTSSEMIDEAVDEMVNALASDCHEPECLILVAPLIAVSAGSLVVSGSIVVVGNTIHWIEKQGRCGDSIIQQTLAALINSGKELGGSVISSGSELVEWFKQLSADNDNSTEVDPNNEI